jgi:hypothetical protein
MTAKTPQMIFVLGMHRSGTSALTGALAKAGICSGDESTLYGPDLNNEKGFYEQREVVEINESVLITDFTRNFPELSDYGCSETPGDLHGLGWLFGAWLDIKNLSIEPGIVTRIERFLHKLWSENPEETSFVIKDPRLSLTLPIWGKYIDDPVIFIMVRHPAAVARPLWRRDRIYESLSHQIWVRYTHAAMVHSTNHKTFVIDYDRFVENPESMIDEIFSWLNRIGFRQKVHKPAEAVKFISPVLRHHQIDTNAGLPAELIELHEAIKKSCPLMPVDYLSIQKIRNDLYPWQSMLYLLAKETAKRKLAETRTDLEAKLLQAEAIHQRLVRHPVAGTVIGLLSKLKQDKSFGALDYHLLAKDK